MTQPITNDWIETVKRLRTENNDLRQNLFVIRLAWAAYGFMGGLFAAAMMYAWARGDVWTLTCGIAHWQR